MLQTPNHETARIFQGIEGIETISMNERNRSDNDQEHSIIQSTQYATNTATQHATCLTNDVTNTNRTNYHDKNTTMVGHASPVGKLDISKVYEYRNPGLSHSQMSDEDMQDGQNSQQQFTFSPRSGRDPIIQKQQTDTSDDLAVASSMTTDQSNNSQILLLDEVNVQPQQFGAQSISDIQRDNMEPSFLSNIDHYSVNMDA